MLDLIDDPAAEAATTVRTLEVRGMDSALALLDRCDQPRSVGEAVAQSAAAASWRSDFIERGLASDDGPLWTAAAEVIGLLRAKEGGADFVTRLLPAPAPQLDERAVGRLLHFLPARPGTWSAVAAYGPSLEDRYWRTLAGWAVAETKEETEHAIRRFNAVDRARDSLHLIGSRLEVGLGPKLIVETLHLALKAMNQASEDTNEPVMRLHYLTRILAYLETHPEVSDETLVLLEWYYFHMLRHPSDQARP